MTTLVKFQNILSRILTCIAGGATLGVFCFASKALAASDGTLGATSTGSSSISITIPPRVQITGVADLAFGTWSGSGDMALSDNVCIYTSEASGAYAVTATGSGAGNAFQVSDGQGNTLAYTLRWNDVASTTGSTAVTAGATLGGQTGACDKSTTCGQGCGNQNANFEVTFSSSALALARAGAYTGTVSLLIDPE